MRVTHYKKGDMLDEISVAGEDLVRLEVGYISGDLFDMGDCYWCPLIHSIRPGSGGLAAYLAELRKMDRPVKFVNIINVLLRIRLEAEGFECIEMDPTP